MDIQLKNSNYINGEWVEISKTNSLKIFHKYNHSLLHEVPFVDEELFEEIVSSAQNGFKEMRKWSAGERAEKLQQLYNLLNENKLYFIELIVQEAGKPIVFATAEVDRALTTLAISIGEATRFGGENIPIDFGAGVGKTAFTKRFPLGVIFCISPFNFPLNLMMHKIAPALAVGNAVIMKPPPQAPLCALALTTLLSQVGYPKGAVNLVNCEIPLAEKLVADNRISMVSFTGSDKVGWHLKKICGKKKITLELGGNAAIIVDEIDQLPNVAKIVAMGAYAYAGQICISTQRIFVNAQIYDRFLPLLLDEINKLPYGDPHEKDTVIGPIIDKKSFEKVNAWVQEAIQQGAISLTNYKVDDQHHLISPVLLTNTKKGMKVVSDEIFGPVAIIEKYRKFSEALELVNDSRYGLQAGIFTNKLDNMKLALDTLEVGGIIMNNAPSFRVDSMPYGGIKDSGFGREGIHFAMEEMSEPRLIVF